MLLPPLLFIALRPDWYYFQNGLDPYFYTGYTQNLDDVIATARDSHYFVSRWSLYLPARFFFRLFGATGGYLVFRWVLTAGCIALIMRLGSRRWGWPAAWLAAISIVISPMFIRAVFSDYSDAIIVPCGIAMIGLLATRANRWWATTLAGVAAGLAVVANAFAVTIVGISLVIALAFLARGRRIAECVIAGTTFLIGLVCVVAAGWLLFRWRYGIDNVYAPTIEYIKALPGRDEPLKRDTLTWLRYFLWIYLPPLVLALAAALHFSKKVRFDRAEAYILITGATTYTFQVLNQFARDGFTLEITYYWSYGLPAFFLALTVVLGRAAARLRVATVVTIAVVTVGVLAAIDTGPELLPHWTIALVIVGGLSVGAFLTFNRHPVVMATVLTAVPIAVPIVGPRPIPLEPDNYNLRPQYDNTFDDAGSEGQRCFRTVTWFLEQMDELGDPTEHATYISGTRRVRAADGCGDHGSRRWTPAQLGAVPSPYGRVHLVAPRNRHRLDRAPRHDGTGRRTGGRAAWSRAHRRNRSRRRLPQRRRHEGSRRACFRRSRLIAACGGDTPGRVAARRAPVPTRS